MMRLLPLLVFVARSSEVPALEGSPSYPNFDQSSLSVDGRDVDAYVPYCAHANSPIILTLHAWATSKDIQKDIDRLPSYAGSECAVIVYPQGKSRGKLFGAVGWSWNAGGCCPNANIDKVDDVTFFDHVITAVAAKFTVNANLVFVVGISNGGMMANRLACTNDRVKAMVAVSGPLLNGTDGKTETFACKRSIPMLHFHGSDDAIIPYYGCNASKTSTCAYIAELDGFPPLPWPTVPSAIVAWRARNGIPAGNEGSITFKNASSSCTSWGSAANNVSFCTIGGEGHAWPGKCQWPASKLPGMHCSYDIDASEETMKFFRRYTPGPTAAIV